MTVYTTGTNIAQHQTALQPFDSKSKPEWYKLRAEMLAQCSVVFSAMRASATFGNMSLDVVTATINACPAVIAYITHAPNEQHARSVIRGIISEGIRSYIDSKDLGGKQ